MKKRIISFFTALSMTLMLFTGIPISVSAVVGDLTTDGYQLDDDGKLTIATDTGMTNWKSVRSSNAKQVKSVVIQDGVTSIVDSAFYGCSSLSSITIPDSVTSIGTETFRNCTSLNSIIIPKRVNKMGGKVFYNCTNLTITFKGGPPTATGDYLRAPVSISGSGVTAIYIPCKQTASSFIDEKIIDGSLSDKIQLAHDATHIEAKEATCTAVGNKEYWKCLQCGKKFSNSECTTEINPTIPRTEHSYGTSWSYDGTNHYHECTVCGDQKDTAAHSGGTATCQTQATCSVCGQKYGSTGSHNYSTAWTTNSTQHYHACLNSGCTDKGDAANHTFVQKSDGTNHWQECSVCEYKKDETAHSWGNWTLTTEPTLNTTGTAERTCGCGEKQTKADVPALSNNTAWIKEETTKPTINADGEYTYTSTDYGTVKVDVPQLTDSTVWTKGDRTDPTVDAAGSQKYTSDYGDVTITIPQLSNTSVWTKTTTPATEEAEGKDVYTSTDYGTVEVVLPKKEHTHDWGNWLITANPTLTTTGTAERACTKDGTHTETKELPVLTDTTVWTITEHVDPTEEDTGKDVYTSEYGDVEVVLPKKEHTHDWGNWSITANPTLTTMGTAKRACTKDGTHTETKELPVLTDTTVWTITEHDEPTEEDTGKDIYTSEYGNVEVVLPKKEHTHDWGNWSITSNPTLTTTGTTERVCTKNSAHKETKELPALIDTTVWTKDDSRHVEPDEDETGKDVYTSEYGEVEVVLPKKEHTHDWGDWSITANPTLTTTGTAKRACTKDGTHTETKELPVLTDTTVWTKDGSQHVDPTEEDTGKDVYTSEYGNVEVVLPKKEHTHVLVKTDAQAADCTTDGNEAYWTCSGCNKIFSDENGTREITAIPTIPATGHKFLTEWANNETYHWHAATCGHDVVSDEAVHSWDSGIVTTEPTEEAAGVKTFTCTVCSATRTESVSQIPHTHTYSTEWTSDSTSHWHAATCGHDVTFEAAAHTEDGGTVTVPATTENDGLKTYACSVCGYVMRTVTIPKLGEDHTHNFSPDWKHDSTSHWHECDCGEKNEIAPHVEDGGVVTTEPTETSTGIMTYSCSVCGYVMRTDVIPALVPEHNHTFGTDWKYDSVSHWHECECGEKSDIANHISSDWIVVTPATTDLEGVQIKRCTVCGIELDRETIEKLPNISTGDVAEDVRDTAGTNAGLVQDNTLIENVLTPDDKTEVTEGHSFEIVLEVTDIRDSVPAADVAAASSALRYNEQIGIYVDLSLFKIKDNSERTPIYNTGSY